MRNVTMTDPQVLLVHLEEFTKTMIRLKIKFFLEYKKLIPPVTRIIPMQPLWQN